MRLPIKRNQNDEGGAQQKICPGRVCHIRTGGRPDKERMAELGITNLSAYLRKMAVDGYIIHLDMSDIQGNDTAPSYLLQ